MKSQSKRIVSLLLSLAMLVSLVSGMSLVSVQAASVDYVYSDNYVYNWGVRDELATFLSPMAQDFYEDNNVAYATLASLSGASSTSDVPYSDLYGALHQLMYDNLDSPTSYDATRNQFKYTDCENSGGSISSFYSAKAIGPSWDSGKTWNREHVWPNSKSNGGSDSNTQRETDIMMLRPASVSENSSRSNTAYGEGSKFYDPNELGQNVRGDAARIVLYVYVCWGGSSQHDGALNYMWGSSGVIESKDILLKWMEEDPVDTWEMGRNDSVESITGTRNVFVDYPELAFLLFDEDVPAGYDSPSGEGASAGYTVTASTNNSNYGTVSVKGSTITASPKTGYAASGYTILSGEATVKQNGNLFTVVPSSDVSVRINFAKREELTVQFVQSGGVATSLTAYIGDSITLPAHSGTVPSGQTFLGWCASEVTETTTKPTYYAPDDMWTVNATATLYALYARSEEGGVVNSDLYELVTDAEDLQIGDKVIVYAVDKNVALSTEQKTNNRGEIAVTVSDDGITWTEGVQVITLEAGNTADTYAFNVGNGYLYAASSSANHLKTEETLSDNSSWSISIDSNGSATIKATGSYTRNWLRYNSSAKLFSCYTSGQNNIALYKQQSGTLYYFTAAKQECAQHTYDNACDAVCNVCGATRTPADHVYTSRVTTAATCGAEGVRTYTCSVCGDTYTDAIAATGAHTYDNACDTACNGCGLVRTITHVYVAAVTKAATCGAEGVRTYTCSVCRVSYTEAIPATGNHTYDNACDADCNACGTARTPSEHVYTANCDTICNVCGAERALIAGGEATITFADATDRLELTTTTQVWQNGDLTVTNNKTASSSNILDYTNPVRFYKGSEIIIAYPGMTSLVINVPTSYGTAWKTTLENADLACEVENGVCIVTFDEPTNSINLTASEQIRADSITAVGAETVAEHTYDNDMDVDCNACGDIRTVEYNLFTFGGNSVSEDVNGLAFKYIVQVSGMVLSDGRGDYSNATVAPTSALSNAKLVMMGAVVSHNPNAVLELSSVNDNQTVIDIQALYFFEADADSATYAVRVRDIPPQHKDTKIYACPYYIYEDADGNEIECYGEVQSASYNSVS